MSAEIKQLPTTTNIENLSLKQLANSANKEVKMGDESFVKGLEHYRQCGEYLIAAKAKGKSEQGSKFRWGKWLEDNFDKSSRVARRNMQLAECWKKVVAHDRFSDDLGVESALKLLSIQPETVDVDVVETEVVKDTPETTKKLTKAEKELAKTKKELEESKEVIKTLKSDNNELKKLPPQQITVIDDKDRIRADNLQEDNLSLREEISQMRDIIDGLQNDLSTQRPPKEQDDPYKDMYHSLEAEKDDEIQQLRYEYEVKIKKLNDKIDNNILVDESTYKRLIKTEDDMNSLMDEKANQRNQPSVKFKQFIETSYRSASYCNQDINGLEPEQKKVCQKIIDLIKPYL